MKTLKKTLCLVLAVVMAVGVLVLPAAAADTTTAAAATVGKDAYDTLHAVGILKGTNASGDAELGRNLSRSDVVAIMYRLMTADVKDEYTSATVEDAKNFADSASFAKWEKGYIGYGWHHEIVKGKGDGTFAPKDNVTGTELLAMLLRALGYGKQGEFEGTGWSKGVKEEANRLALLKGLTNYDPSKAATRGQAFIMVVNACGNNIVTWDGHKYVDTGKKLVDIKEVETAAAVKANSTVDDFGAPAAGTTASYKVVATCNFPVVPRELTSAEIKGKADAAATPVLTFYTPMTMCDIVTAVSAAKDKTFITYTNGKGNVGAIKITDDTTTTIGAYGRETNIYAYKDGKTGADVYSIVFKDVVLAKTGATIAAGSSTTDFGGHVTAGAKETREVSSVWYNNAMLGLAVPNGAVRPATGLSAANGNCVTDNKTDVTGPAEKSFFSSYVLTSAGNAAVTSAEKTLVVKDAAVKAETITFTEPIFVYVNGVPEIVGIRDGGKDYYYSISYSYNSTVASPNGCNAYVPQATDIGKTYVVYTDGHNNIIGIDREVGASDTGYGVITGIGTSTAITGTGSVIPGAGTASQYAIQVTVLTEKGETKTMTVVKGLGTAAGTVEGFTAADEVDHLIPAFGTLVNWHLIDSKNNYYTLSTVRSTSLYNTEFDAGVADAYTFNSNSLVNNTTVFFVAKYSMKNSLGGYSFDGYQVFTGFQADGLRDLSYKSGRIFVNGKEVVGVNGLEVSYVTNADVNDDDMDYVLVNYATQWSTSTQTVPEYALFKTGVNASGTIVDDNYNFNIFQNGVDTVLPVNNDYAKGVLTPGLRILEKDTNGTSKVPTRIVNWVDSNNTWSYKDGVITLGTPVELNATGRAAKYLTVVPNVAIYQFNTVNGKVQATTQTIEQLYKLYKGAFEFFFELNVDGYVSTIYAVERQGAAGGTGATTPNVVSALTLKQTKAVAVNKSTKDEYFTVTVDTATAATTGTATVTWYKANETTGKFEVYEGDIFVKGTYYASIAIAVKDASIAATATLNVVDTTLATKVLPTVTTEIFTIG